MRPAQCVFPAQFCSTEAQGSEYTDLIKEEALSSYGLITERETARKRSIECLAEFGGGQTSSRGFRQAFIVNNSRQNAHCDPGV